MFNNKTASNDSRINDLCSSNVDNETVMLDLIVYTIAMPLFDSIGIVGNSLILLVMIRKYVTRRGVTRTNGAER